MSDNPFKHIYGAYPYHPNPFAVLGASRDMNQAGLERFASNRDRLVIAGGQPIANFNLEPGDCITAAQLLQDPVWRLAFDLMDCPELDQEYHEEANRD